MFEQKKEKNIIQQSLQTYEHQRKRNIFTPLLGNHKLYYEKPFFSFDATKLIRITFNHSFDSPIMPRTLPDTVQQLYFGKNFNQELNLPAQLVTLKFHRLSRFNQKIVLPFKLKHLTFGCRFNQTLLLSPSLETFVIEFKFNDIFCIDTQFNKPINIPYSLTKLSLQHIYPHVLSNVSCKNENKHLLQFNNHLFNHGLSNIKDLTIDCSKCVKDLYLDWKALEKIYIQNCTTNIFIGCNVKHISLFNVKSNLKVWTKNETKVSSMVGTGSIDVRNVGNDIYDFIKNLESVKSVKFSGDHSHYNEIDNVLEKVSIEKLEFGYFFNRNITIPWCVQELHLGHHFNQVLVLPENLKVLVLGDDFDKPLVLNKKLKRLKIGKNFNQKLYLNSGLYSLCIGQKFNQSLILNNNLIRLIFVEFSHFNNVLIFNKKLEVLKFGIHFNKELSYLPESLKQLWFPKYSLFCHEIRGVEKIEHFHASDIMITKSITSHHNTNLRTRFEVQELLQKVMEPDRIVKLGKVMDIDFCNYCKMLGW